MSKNFERYHHWEVTTSPADGFFMKYYLVLFVGHDPTEQIIYVGEGYDGRKLAYERVLEENAKLKKEGKLYG